MVDETIVNQIQITGLDKATKDLQDFGNTGEAALNKVTAASAGGFAGIGDAAAASFGKLGRASQDIGTAANAFSDLNVGVKATRASLQQFIPSAISTQTVMGKLSGIFGGIISGLRGTSTEAAAAGVAMNSANRSATSFGTTLRLLGRATGERELGQLGRTVSILGRSFAIAAPAILAVGLEKIASSATTAASNLADLAGQLRISVSEFAKLQSISSATGLSQDKLNTSFKAVQTLIKDTADAEAKGAAQQAQLNDQINASRDAADKAARGFVDLNKAQADLALDLAAGTVTIEQYNKSSADLAKQHRDLADQVQKLDDETAKLQRTQQLANIEAINSGTALQKLGINALDAAGKLKKPPGVLLEIADALKQLGPGAARTEIEFDLIAAGLDRKLLPALRQGSEAFQQIEKDSANINPGFTDAQIKTADDFSIAVSKAGDAWGNLVNQLGVAIAPTFIGFFEQVQKIFSDITPGVVEFGKALASVVIPVLQGFATILQQGVIPLIQAFFSLLDGVAGLINSAFGTNATGMQIFVGLLLAIAIAFGGVATAVTVVVAGIGILIKLLQDSGVNFQSLGQVASDVWKAILQVGTDIVTGLTDIWNKFVEFFTNLWIDIQAAPGKAWTAIADAGDIVVKFLLGIWENFKNTAIGWWLDIQNAVLGVWNNIKDIWAKVTGSTGPAPTIDDTGGAAGAISRAAGGPIWGRGTSTSDSIPIWGSTGEFMQPAKAVKKYGLAFMEAIRTLRFDPSALAFALGGGIGIPSSIPKMRFADGGLVQPHGNTLNLTIQGEQFPGLRVEDDTMKKLTRFATNQQVRSAGRKPSWHR